MNQKKVLKETNQKNFKWYFEFRWDSFLETLKARLTADLEAKKKSYTSFGVPEDFDELDEFEFREFCYDLAEEFLIELKDEYLNILNVTYLKRLLAEDHPDIQTSRKTDTIRQISELGVLENIHEIQHEITDKITPLYSLGKRAAIEKINEDKKAFTDQKISITKAVLFLEDEELLKLASIGGSSSYAYTQYNKKNSPFYRNRDLLIHAVRQSCSNNFADRIDRMILETSDLLECKYGKKYNIVR